MTPDICIIYIYTLQDHITAHQHTSSTSSSDTPRSSLQLGTEKIKKRWSTMQDSLSKMKVSTAEVVLRCREYICKLIFFPL